jgi:predicted N-acetyltransferase YhbS
MEIRQLTEADVPAAQHLREQAGWNQTDDDWRRLLAWSPDGCWGAEQDRQVVGTTTVTTYGRRIAWVGMVLVDEAHRRQGIGRALLNHAIAYLDSLGVQTIALDSTPEGQPLYARLGFVDAFELARWRGAVGDITPANGESQIRPITPNDVTALAAYDAQLFGTDRVHILRALYGGHPVRCFLAERHGRIVGYALSRPGARAWHLGPLAADDPQTAERLARTALPPGEGVMDVVLPNADAVVLARTLGLGQVRRFIRMTRGAPAPTVDIGRLYTSAGPELG